MSYYEWLIKNYAEKDTAIGDLARDILSDEMFPENDEYSNSPSVYRGSTAKPGESSI